jgi:hypothetical protein
MMRRMIFVAGAMALALPAQAEDYKTQTGLEMIKVIAREGHPAALVNVVNGSKVRLDVDVVCTFFKGNAVVTKGAAQVTVLPKKAEPLEVRSARVLTFEKASCEIESAKP